MKYIFALYQYFEDKQDLFIYLVEHATHTLLAGLEPAAPAATDEDFFTILRRLMSASVWVNVANPQLSLILRRSSQAPAQLRQELAQRTGAAAQNYYFQLIQRAIQQGDLRGDIEPMLVTFMLGSLLSELGTYISAMLGLDPQNVVTVDAAVFASPQVEAIFDQVIEVLREGLGKKELI